MAMKRLKMKFVWFASILIATALLHIVTYHGITKSFHRPGAQKQVVHIAFTCCGRCLEESFVMIKSAVLLTRSTLLFHIHFVFTETALRQDYSIMCDTVMVHILTKFEEDLIDMMASRGLTLKMLMSNSHASLVQFDSVQRLTGKEVGYTFYNISFPDTPGFTAKAWARQFRPCASQRLFFPRLMENVDAVLYVDTDTLFFTPPENILRHLKKFNSTHIAGLAPESTGEPSNSWYEDHLKTPHYGLKGLNSGVMLMNLTLIRSHQWEESLAEYAARYKEHLILGDQDLLNIYFHFHPEQLFLCPCEMNYRPNLCQPKLLCDRPAHILHGNNFAFQRDGGTPFQAIHEAFKQFSGPLSTLPALVEKAIINYPKKSDCSEYVHLFVDELYKQLK